MKYVAINNKILLEKNGFISIKERACRFGDGIFETCKIIDGFIYNYEAHKARISKGLKGLEIFTEINDLKKTSYNLIKKNKIKNGSLRISISRGIGSKGYLPTYQSPALIIIEAIEDQKILENKISLGISKIKTQKHNNALIGCKTMQSLNYILAKIEAKKSGNFDNILLNEKGYISECSSANIFWVKNGKIFTPSKKCDLIFGTIRKKIIEKSSIKINLVEARLSSLLSADEVFITNSNLLVLAIDEINFSKKIIHFKKEISLRILELIMKDVIYQKIKDAA